jgi:RNA polymerase sigma factor (TIGR02999 family)
VTDRCSAGHSRLPCPCPVLFSGSDGIGSSGTAAALPARGGERGIDPIQATVAQHLEALQGGDEAALADLFPILYEELRLVAHQQRRRWHSDDTLGTTALVNEVYLKLHRQKRIGTASREHFLALASRAMRHILSTYAEQRRTLKRGGGLARVPLDEAHTPAADAAGDDGEEVLAALDGALHRLEETHPRHCRVVECRFFGGLTVEETATALGTSTRTIKRHWAFAQAWLKRELGEVL